MHLPRPYWKEQVTCVVEQSIRDEVTATEREFVTAANSMDEAALREPSLLPGWTRAHVFAHVATLADAFARQAEAAARGAKSPVYDSPDAREAAIEAGARWSLSEVREQLERAFTRIDQAWPTSQEGWDSPVTYRNETVEAVAFGWWRETSIHLVDLDVGRGFDTWSVPLCRHLWSFLTQRLPGDEAFVLWSTDQDVRAEVGGGSYGAVQIAGRLVDITAWLAGRVPTQQPAAHRDGRVTVLPELNPWPSAARVVEE